MKADDSSSRYTSERVALAAQLACVLEVSAEKPGNVTPAHAFRDMGYEDFLRSALAIGPELGRAGERGVGETVLAAIHATQHRTRANVNLGIVLLFAPLAKAALTDRPEADLRARLSAVLRQLTVDDAIAAYTAIRLATPGGLEERVEQHDVRDTPAVTLREAMAGAVGRDNIAAEYLSDYAVTFERGLPALKGALTRAANVRQAIVQAYLELLAALPDTLIARKQGGVVAQTVSDRATQVVAAGGVFTAEGRRALEAFDAGLRDVNNRFNPGATADLIAATLFVAGLEGVV